MRTIKILLLCLILVGIVILSLANREIVTLNLLPSGMDRVLKLSVEMPLFLVSLLSIVVGLIIGYLLEWLREHKHRRRASQKAKEAAQLGREVDRLRKSSGKADDDVLALLGN